MNMTNSWMKRVYAVWGMIKMERIAKTENKYQKRKRKRKNLILITPTSSTRARGASTVEHAVLEISVRLVAMVLSPGGLVVIPRRGRIVDIAKIVSSSTTSKIGIEYCGMNVDRTSGSAKEVAEVMSLVFQLRLVSVSDCRKANA
jgi:hypothetical protein